MKKMKKIQSKETNELIMALRLGAACAIEFVAIVIGVPAKIMLGIAGWMAKMAVRVAGEPNEHIQPGMTAEELIREIADV